MARRVTSPKLVGRAGEMEQLLAALAGAESGEPALLIIEGEAGIGKSRLVAEFAATARERGARVASGACVELAAGPLPYGPLIQVARDLVAASGGDRTALAAAPDGAPLRWLVPDLERPGAAGDTRIAEAAPPAVSVSIPEGFDQARLFDAMLDLLRSFGGPGATVVIIEDIHWADPATLDVLRFLLRVVRDEHAMLVATCRSDGLLPAPVRHAIVELARSPLVERVALERLGPAEVREMLAQIRGQDGHAEPDESIVRRSQGNPLFAEELLAAGRASTAGDLPRNLRDLLLDRLGHLGEPAQAILRAMAIVGHASDESLLAAASGLDSGQTVAGLREAIDQQLVLLPGNQEVGAYWFRHDLVADAIRSDLLAGERQRLHAAVAASLARRTTEAGVPGAVAAAELAHHWRAAGRPTEALRTAIAAAGLARDVWSYAEEARQYSNALDLWSEVADPAAVAGTGRPDLLERLAAAWYDAGEFEQAVTVGRDAISAAAPLGDRRRLGALTQRLGSYLSSADRDEEALDAHRAAARLLEDAPQLLARVLASTGATLMLLGRYGESSDACSEALRLATESGSPEFAASARMFLGVDRVYLGRVSDGLAELEEAIAIARAAGATEALLDAYHNIGCMFELVDRLDESLAAANAGIALADSAGFDRRSGAGLRAVSGRALYRLGRWADAEAAFRDGLAMDPRGEHRLNLLRGYAQLLAGQGRLEQARLHLHEAAADTRLDSLPEYALASAEAALAADLLDEARAALDVALTALARTDDMLRSPALSVIGLRVEADQARLAAAGRRSMELDRARTLGSTHLDWVRATVAATAGDAAGALAGGIRLCAAEAEWSRLEGTAEPDRWRALRDLVEQTGARPEVAYASYRLAEAVLASRGSRAEAGVALAEAADTARAIGAKPLLDRIEEFARRGRLDLAASDRPGAPPPATASAAPGIELTPREREVVELLTDGRTNRQIAETLFITEKTAAIHVSNILGKLGVTNRYDAADVARRSGLVAPAAPGPWPRSETTEGPGARSTIATGAALPGSERVLATVLFTDIVGSTEFAARLGDSGWRALLERHHAIVRRELARFGGREIDTAGDGFFAVFDGPARAVRAAVAIREALESIALKMRAGIHTGECEISEGKVVGIAVSVGARISSRADPGEVLVSHTVRDLVAGSGLRFQDRGEHQLKGLPGEWHLFAASG